MTTTLPPILKIYAAFGSTWTTEPAFIVWTEITGDVMDRRQAVTLFRGSTADGGGDGGDPGRGQMALRNHHRHYDKNFVDGPYFGQLLAGVPIKAVATIAGSTADDFVWGSPDDFFWGAQDFVWGESAVIGLWRGTINAWPQRYDQGNETATVSIDMADPFDKLALARFPRSVVEAEIAVDTLRGFWPLDETTGDAMVDRSGNGRDGTYIAGTTATSGSIVTTVEIPALDLTGDGEAFVDTTVVDRGHTIAALVDISDVADLVAGQRLPLFEFGVGGRKTEPIQWGVEIVSAVGPTARIYLRGAEAAWSSPGYSATFDASAPVHICSAASGVVFFAAHYVNGELSTGTTSPPVFTGQAAGVRVLGSKTAGRFRGKAAAVLWAAFDAINPTRIAAIAEALLNPLDGQTTDERANWVLDQAGWPAGLRDIEPGRTTLGPAVIRRGDSILAYLRSLYATEDARFFITTDCVFRGLDRYWVYRDAHATVPQVELTDDGTGVGVATFQLEFDDTALVVNTARYTRRGGTEQVAVDELSKQQNGELEKQLGDLLHRTDPETRAQAQWTVATRSEPVDRVRSVLIRVHKLSVEDQALILRLDIGHRVRSIRTPQNIGTSYTIDGLLDGTELQVQGVEWLLTLYLSPAPDVTAELFTLGTSPLGGTHILAY